MEMRILIAARDGATLKYLGALAHSACMDALLVFARGEGEAARALYADGPFRLVLLSFAPGPALQVHLAPQPYGPEWLHASEGAPPGKRTIPLNLYIDLTLARERILSILKT